MCTAYAPILFALKESFDRFLVADLSTSANLMKRHTKPYENHKTFNQHKTIPFSIVEGRGVFWYKGNNEKEKVHNSV